MVKIAWAFANWTEYRERLLSIGGGLFSLAIVVGTAFLWLQYRSMYYGGGPSLIEFCLMIAVLLLFVGLGASFVIGSKVVLDGWKDEPVTPIPVIISVCLSLIMALLVLSYLPITGKSMENRRFALVTRTGTYVREIAAPLDYASPFTYKLVAFREDQSQTYSLISATTIGMRAESRVKVRANLGSRPLNELYAQFPNQDRLETRKREVVQEAFQKSLSQISLVDEEHYLRKKLLVEREIGEALHREFGKLLEFSAVEFELPHFRF